MQTIFNLLNQLKTILTTCIFILCTFQCIAQVSDISYVSYSDSTFEIGAIPMSNKKSNIQKKRSNITLPIDSLYSRKGKFKVWYDDSYFMTEGVKHCLLIAMNIWEEILKNDEQIYFYVCVSEDMDPDIAIRTSVCYKRAGNRTSMPRSLYYQNYDDTKKDKDIDTIYINAFIDWNVSWPQDNIYIGSVNLTSAFLRHIAHMLGFGHSIVKRKDGMGFAVLQCPSAYDRILSNGETVLSRYAINGGNNIAAFFSKELFLTSSGVNYKLYSPGSYISRKTGCYFSLEHNNLMEYPFPNPNELYPVNSETLDIIKNIGWGHVIPHDIQIVSEHTDATGYGSIYKRHLFSACENGDPKKKLNGTWDYQLYNTEDRKYESVCRSSGELFSVEPEIYNNNLDKFQCQEARIVFSYGGKEYSYLLFLETRPQLISVQTSNVKEQGDYCYSFDLNITALGYRTGTVLVSDNTGTVRQYKFDGSIIHVEQMHKGYAVYIDICLENEFGETYSFDQYDLMSKSSNVISVSGKSIKAASVYGSDLILIKNGKKYAQ